LAKDIHPIDQIELHKQTGEMVYSTLTNKAITAHQLQNSLHNTSAQLQLEKASSQAKDTRIKTLEDLVIELGHDPKDVKAAEQLIKKKNDDIAALKKQLKIPPLHHPQTAEVIEKQKEEELMDLVLKLNDQLKETEKELEKQYSLSRVSCHRSSDCHTHSFYSSTLHSGNFFGTNTSTSNNIASSRDYFNYRYINQHRDNNRKNR
jgi:hypothetical protein